MIEVTNLCKFYGSLPAIQDVTFTVQRGEVVGFLGPNGAGKTTTLKILTCFMPATSGEAVVDGFNCHKEPLKVKSRIGYMPEAVPLYGDMTVNAFLKFSGEAKGLSGKKLKTEIDRVLEEVDIIKVKNRLIKNLSKGYKQRVGLAQALLNNPSILILDEPTIGLDPAQIVEIRNLIKKLGGERTVLLSSHILPEVRQLCHRVLIINKGRIIATDTPEGLTRQLQKYRQVELSIRAPISPEEVEKELLSVDGVVRIERKENGKSHEFLLELERDKDIRPEIARTTIGKGWDLLEMKTVDLSLEDIFLQLVTEEETK